MFVSPSTAMSQFVFFEPIYVLWVLMLFVCIIKSSYVCVGVLLLITSENENGFVFLEMKMEFQYEILNSWNICDAWVLNWVHFSSFFGQNHQVEACNYKHMDTTNFHGVWSLTLRGGKVLSNNILLCLETWHSIIWSKCIRPT